MACVILRPEPQALFDSLRNAFSNTVLGGGKVIPESNEWYVIANDYAARELVLELQTADATFIKAVFDA